MTSAQFGRASAQTITYPTPTTIQSIKSFERCANTLSAESSVIATHATWLQLLPKLMMLRDLIKAMVHRADAELPKRP